MAMRPCSKCLENQWAFLFDDATRIVTATCKFCAAEVSFPARQKNRNRPMSPQGRRQSERSRKNRERPVTTIGANFHEYPNFIDDGIPPWL